MKPLSQSMQPNVIPKTPPVITQSGGEKQRALLPLLPLLSLLPLLLPLFSSTSISPFLDSTAHTTLVSTKWLKPVCTTSIHHHRWLQTRDRRTSSQSEHI